MTISHCLDSASLHRNEIKINTHLKTINHDNLGNTTKPNTVNWGNLLVTIFAKLP
jgi:hypothetical protein